MFCVSFHVSFIGCSHHSKVSILERIGVVLVLENRVRRQIENSPQCVADPIGRRLVTGQSIPNRYYILLFQVLKTHIVLSYSRQLSGQRALTAKRIETTAPHISSPTMNCSPSMARIRFSQQREARPFLRRTIHLPPQRLASS